MNVTLELARFVATSRLDAIDESVQDEAVRALVNWLGCALGGCLDPAVDTVMDALAGAFGPAQATLIGRGDRVDVLHAALLGGTGAAILDYDETHLAARVRPSMAVASALLPLAEWRAARGAEVVHAFLLGQELACRAGLAMRGEAVRRGWHASSICGVLGAAAACAKLLGLDDERTAYAIGIAATQASGLGEMVATPGASLDIGFAARNGLMAALLAQQGFTSSVRALEAARGLLHVLAGAAREEEALVSGLGCEWELKRNAYKAYACDAMLHPVIEACLQLKLKHKPAVRSITGIDLRVHPHVLELAPLRQPASGFESRASIHHAAAVALIHGTAGVRQFQDERVVANARLAELRTRVEAIADTTLHKEEAHVAIHLQDGRTFERRVRYALGSAERPMSDADLCAKFRDLAADGLATDQVERVLALAWNVRALADVGALIRATVPEDELEPAELPGSPLIPR